MMEIKNMKVDSLGKKSERRGSNPRHPAWEADTLPTELRSQLNKRLM